ncbi:hypothetical protein E8E11_002340 [Didymella keratinophila]|nr:hypothetical protein E8E11_002340 [Didymella keratinophila]
MSLLPSHHYELSLTTSRGNLYLINQFKERLPFPYATAPSPCSPSAAYTGASLNPARSFAVNVVNGQSQGYHWIYWVGPAMGALLATGFYLLIRKLEYWMIDSEADSYQSKIGEKPIATPEE